ncbi:MAG: PhzF family phenazine biosynthesis isomerase, partial [Nostoc sp. LLA-1]|nr:PhzF family phenazine biosynthesis isomerase [Cyanocohniella sp. LLY]
MALTAHVAMRNAYRLSPPITIVTESSVAMPSENDTDMTEFRMFQADAFTQRRFAGNPAAVVLLDEWLPDTILTAIAAENNLAETAFLVAADDGAHELRWFTPTVEVPLCGHATLASALVLAQEVGLAPPFRFHTRKSGTLLVERTDAGFSMRLPRRQVNPGGDAGAVAA